MPDSETVLGFSDKNGSHFHYNLGFGNIHELCLQSHENKLLVDSMMITHPNMGQGVMGTLKNFTKSNYVWSTKIYSMHDMYSTLITTYWSISSN